MKLTGITGTKIGQEFRLKEGYRDRYPFTVARGVYSVRLDNRGCEILLFRAFREQNWNSADEAHYRAILDAAPDNLFVITPAPTAEQLPQLMALYALGYRYIAQDVWERDVYAYEKLPHLDSAKNCWLGGGEVFSIPSDNPVIKMVSHKDEQPLNIKERLDVVNAIKAMDDMVKGLVG